MLTRDRLHTLLRRSGLSQAELARRLGVNPMWGHNRLTGHSAILADEITRLAAALEVDPRELLATPDAPLSASTPPEQGIAEPAPSVGAAPPHEPSASVDRMVAEYERELGRARAGEPMDPEIERMFVEYLREQRRLTAAQVQAVLQLVAALGAGES